MSDPIQTPAKEDVWWSNVDLDNPVDLHGDPPYQLAPVTDRLTSTLSPYVPGRVLDMGCGVGRLTNLLARSFGSDTVMFGFDIAAPNVHEATLGAPGNALYWHSDGRTIPAGITGIFDLIYSITMFQHIPHDAKWGYIVQAAERRPDEGRTRREGQGDRTPVHAETVGPARPQAERHQGGSRVSTCPGCGCITPANEPTEQCGICKHAGCRGCVGLDGLCDPCHDIEKERNG